MFELTTRQQEEIPHKCLVQARAQYATLPAAERKALDWLLGNPREVAGVSIVNAATRAGCSEATLVRLCKRLGYSGFPHLKAEFGGSNANEAVIYRGIGESDDPLAVAEKVFAASVQSLRDTLSVVDKEQYRKALSLLLGARRILLCGLGDASTVAAAMYQKFIRVNSDAQTTEDPDLQLIMASHLASGDLIIAISHSGNSTTIINAVRCAKNAGAVAIVLSNFHDSPLADLADALLLTADFAQHLNGEVISKRVSELCLLESLYVNFLIARKESALAAQTLANEAVEVYKAPLP